MEDAITKEQLIEVLDDKFEELEVKMDVKLGDVENKLGTKIDNLETRLSRRIATNHTINIKHHLATRQELGAVNRSLIEIREGLSQAAGDH